MYNRESWIKGNALRKQAISPPTHEMIVGTMLGDGHIVTTSSNNFFLSLHHGAKQVEYLSWKAVNMRELFIDPLTIVFHKATDSYQVRSVCRRDLEPYKNDEFLLNELTLDSMAVWYGDDGWLNKREGAIHIELGNRMNERLPLVSKALDRLGIEHGFLKRSKGDYYRLRVCKEPSQKLLARFSKILPKCLQYKTLTSETIRRASQK